MLPTEGLGQQWTREQIGELILFLVVTTPILRKVLLFMWLVREERSQVVNFGQNKKLLHECLLHPGTYSSWLP